MGWRGEGGRFVGGLGQCPRRSGCGGHGTGRCGGSGGGTLETAALLTALAGARRDAGGCSGRMRT